MALTSSFRYAIRRRAVRHDAVEAREELGFGADVHGFRTSFRTWVQEKTEFSRELAEAALARAVGDAVEQAYARPDFLERRRAMMDAWAGFLGLTLAGC